MSALQHEHPPVQLLRRKSGQIGRFRWLRARFAERYAAVRDLDAGPWILDEWVERNRPLEGDLLPVPRFDFLRHESILHSMFVGPRYVEPELPAALELIDEELGLLEEDVVGEPPLLELGGVATSSNLVHHAHHLARFAEEVGAHPARLDTVVEWGGGYGSLARLHRRLHGGAPTYVIVDTPLFSCVQWLYLSSILGTDEVDLATTGPVHPRRGRVTLVPVPLVDSLHLNGSDLFISTWALNESSQRAQDHVVARDWFGARHLLLGMHEGVDLAGRAVAGGARIEPVGDWMPGQTYVWR